MRLSEGKYRLDQGNGEDGFTGRVHQAGMNNTLGIQNSFFGHGSGFLNTTGNDNSFFGKIAGVSNTTGSSNAFFGRSAGITNTTESNNTFVGSFADGDVGVTNATAIGSWAKVTRSNSLVLGSISGTNGATADTNVGIGTTSPKSRLSVVGDIDITASYKIDGATVLSIAGSNNTFAGQDAGQANTTGYSNSFFGHMAGYSNQAAWFNSFFGEASGYSNFSGIGNSFFGSYAGHYNANGSGNSAFGSNAGLWVTGSNNSFVGSYAGQFNSYGTDNSFVGHHAGSTIGTGSYNSIVGSSAGRSLSGDNNSVFGAYADVIAGSNNATAIGYRAQVAQDNSLVLGSINGVNGSIADTRVGIGTTAPGAKLDVIGPYGLPGGSIPTSWAERVTGRRGVVRDNRGLYEDIWLGPYGYYAELSSYKWDDKTTLPLVLNANGGNVGIGAVNPKAKLQADGGDIYIGSPGQGIILKSPDGLVCVRLTVSNAGALVATPQACP